MTKVICNCCGKEINSATFHLDEVLPYGSKYDGDSFTIDLCTDCSDKLTDMIRSLCKIDPVAEF